MKFGLEKVRGNKIIPRITEELHVKSVVKFVERTDLFVGTCEQDEGKETQDWDARIDERKKRNNKRTRNETTVRILTNKGGVKKLAQSKKNMNEDI